MVNVKRLITPIIASGVGLFTFIFMALSYYANSFGGISGYKSIGRLFKSSADASFLAVLVSILLICLLIVAVAVLAAGIFGFIKECINVDVFKDETMLGRLSVLSLKVYLIIDGAAAALYLLFCIINGFDIFPGVGFWFLLIIGVGGFVTNYVLNIKFAAEIADRSTISYKCSSCNSSAKASEKFCSKCGSPVIAVRNAPAPEYRCSACNAKATEKDKFCSKCGSPVIMIQPATMSYRCSSCGASAKENEKFCSQCGAPVIAVRDEINAGQSNI